MSSTKKPAKQKEPNSKTGLKLGRKPSGITGRSRRRPAGETSAKTNGNSESQNCGGLLRSAIEREVARNTDLIAKALVEGSIHGNVTNAKLLIDISGAKTAARDNSGTRAAWAAYLDELENEEQWTDSMEDKEESNEDDEESYPKSSNSGFIDPLL